MSVLIVDYGMCNLGSVRRAFEECGADVWVSDNPHDADHASHIVLPGVGAFGDAMKNLIESGWDTAIKKNADQSIPILGVCLGMQLLAEKGFEGGDHEGLGLIGGEVVSLHGESSSLRIPHVGWNEIYRQTGHPLIENVQDTTDFYFVHSYYFKTANPENIIAVTNYGLTFPSIVGKDKVMGVQFHPEKSSKAGFQIIQNFLTLN